MNTKKHLKIQCNEVLCFMKKFYIMGEDKRQLELKKLYGGSVTESLNEASYIIMPTPLTKDGVNITGGERIDDVIPLIKGKIVFAGKIPEKVARKLEKNFVSYYDLMEQEDLAIKNTIPTAEGVILKMLQEQTTTIHGSNVLVLGFGKCGKILADRLSGMKANVFCEARRKKDLAHIESLGYNSVDITNLSEIMPKMDIVVNTVPYMLMSKEMLDLLKQDALLIDIASAPGGTDFEYCKKKNIRAYLELGIPSKIAYKTAAKYIKETIDSVILGEAL